MTFIKNRLEIAKLLLKNDGIIVVHLDQIEQAYLQTLMDEIFGRENFVNSVCVKSSTPSGTKTVHKNKTIIKQKDYLLFYRKSESARFNPQYKRRNSWDTHFNYYLDKKRETLRPLLEVIIENNLLPTSAKLSDFNIDNPNHRKFYLEHKDVICQTQSHKNESLKEESKKLKDKVLFINRDLENEVMFYNGRQLTPLKNSINEVIYNGKKVEDVGMLICDFWDDIDFQNTQNEGGISFTNGKKPEELLYRIIDLTTSTGDLVLDFFAGSGTTACVALKLNRKFITIEQMDYIKELPVERLVSVIDGELSGISKIVNWKGGGSFIYCELKKDNQLYIDRIQDVFSKDELITVWNDMESKATLSYQFDKVTFNERIAAFKTASIDEMKQYLIEVLDKNQLYVNYSEINDAKHHVSDDDKQLNKQFYTVKR